MIFSSNLGLVSFIHSLPLQVLITSNVPPDLLAGTWGLSWLPLLVSPLPFHPVSLSMVIKSPSFAVGKVGVFFKQEVDEVFFWWPQFD
jgi:hypothetical protein